MPACVDNAARDRPSTTQLPVTPEQQAELDRILDQHKDLFVKPRFGTGPNFVPECIPIPADVVPPNTPAFRLSLAHRRELEERIKDLLDSGGIQPSSSPFGAPVLFTPKPDGTLRMCIDYRKITRLRRRTSSRCRVWTSLRITSPAPRCSRR